MNNNFDKFKKIIQSNIDYYIINNKYEKKSSGCFNELLNKDRANVISEQSVNIKMGNVLEKSFKDFLIETDQVLVDERSKINHVQIDLLFLYKDIIYYFEVKNNINLDTEKSKTTLNKIKKIEDFLKKESPKKQVVSKILNSRYSGYDVEILNFIKKPLSIDDIYGYQKFFEIFDISVKQEEWESFFGQIGSYIYLEKEN